VDAHFVDFLHWWSSKDTREFGGLFLEIAAGFIGLQVGLGFPQPNRYPFACAAVGQQHEAYEPFLLFGSGDDGILKDGDGFLAFIGLNLDGDYTCLHGSSPFVGRLYA